MRQERLVSLDVVRGLTVAGMIMVNDGYGDTFDMLRHAGELLRPRLIKSATL